MTVVLLRAARKERIADTALCDAVARAVKGQIDADLGGSVLKQRVATPGAGRSGDYRVILLFQAGDRGNIGDDELVAFRQLAAEVLALSGEQLDALVAAGRFMEVECDGSG